MGGKGGRREEREGRTDQLERGKRLEEGREGLINRLRKEVLSCMYVVTKHIRTTLSYPSLPQLPFAEHRRD